MSAVQLFKMSLPSSIRPHLPDPKLPALAMACLALLAGLSGCSTPQAALEEANYSTKLMSMLDVQLRELRRVEKASEDTQLRALAAQRYFLSRLQTSGQLDAAASKSSGDTPLAELTRAMLADSDAIAANRDATAALSAAYAKTLESLMTPLSDSAPTLAQAQAKMASMGAELDREARTKELIAFAKDVKKSVDENKAKIKDAEKAAATAAAGAASAAAAAVGP